MKKFFQFLGILVFTSFFTNCNGQPTPKYTAQASGADRIEVLDFHNEHRCHTCIEIERVTRKILDDNYAKEMKKGLITFRLLNAEDKANRALVEKYNAYGTTLIISSVKNGKEEFVDVTNFAFLNFNKEEKYTEGIMKELKTALSRIRS